MAKRRVMANKQRKKHTKDKIQEINGRDQISKMVIVYLEKRQKTFCSSEEDIKEAKWD